MRSPLELRLCAVLVSLRDDEPVVAVLDEQGTRRAPRLPTDRLDVEADPTLEIALRRQVRTQLGLDVGYVEQLYTFGDRDRDPRTAHGWPRAITVAYLGLVQEPRSLAAGARWAPLYEFLRWEDSREGIAPALGVARAAALAAKLDERAAISLPESLPRWDEYRALDRYELLYELGLVPESGSSTDTFGAPMELDHRRILATALGRLRGKLRYRPVVFELLDETFTLYQLQCVVEAIAGVRLHKQNFRRLVERGGLVEPTGDMDRSTGGRPAACFRFRREVLFERQAPGIGFPRGGA